MVSDIKYNISRPSRRKPDELRVIDMKVNYQNNAEGSCLISYGDTMVLCTATIEEKVPPFLRNKGSGWITSEYGMLPRSTNSRTIREATRGKQTGRTQEIQRLIGRSLRSAVDLSLLGERQIIIDCDVIKADGGTRTASITGSWVALNSAIKKLINIGKIKKSPINCQVAAISCGLWKGMPILDLDYAEDSNADVDANFVFSSDGKIIEVQVTAEKNPFSKSDFDRLIELANLGAEKLFTYQINASND